MEQNWTYKKLEDSIEKIKYTTKIQSSDYKSEGLFPIVSQEDELISGYWDNASDVFKINKPVVIFGDHTRVLKYVDFDFVLGADGVKILQPIDDLSAKFFLYYLKWCNIPSLGYSRHYKLLKDINIPLPPLSTQSRIVSELDLLQSIIDKQKAQLKEYDTLAQSIFYDMFGDILESTPIKCLKDVAEYYIGLTYSPNDVADKGTVVLRSSNIQNNVLDFEDTVRVNVTITDKKIVQDGDILMCARNGSARLVGKVARIKNLSEKMSFGAFMTIIRSPYNDYLFQFFLSHYFRNQLTTSKTATINQITTKMLDGIKLNVPSLKQQQYFAQKIEAIERQKGLINQSIRETQTLFDSRMEYYFGE